MAETYLRNTNSHGVRAGGVRIGPGQVGRVEDDSQLKGAKGVESASKSDYDSQQAERAGGGNDEAGVPGVVETKLRESRLASRLAVSAPLQRVVGDDQAPLGSPTGTVTTKHIAAKESREDERAFGPNEARPGDKIEEGEPGFSGRAPSQAVHNQQVENTEAVEEATQALIDEEQSGGSSEAQTREQPAAKSRRSDKGE